MKSLVNSKNHFIILQGHHHHHQHRVHQLRDIIQKVNQYNNKRHHHQQQRKIEFLFKCNRMKREGDTTMKCHPVNTTPPLTQHNNKHLMTQSQQTSSSAIMDFDKQQRTMVTKIDVMARQIFESLRELRDLLSRSPPTTSERIKQADFLLEQVNQNQIQLDQFIANMKKSKSISTGPKQQNDFLVAGLKQPNSDMLSLKPTAPLFPPRVTLNPILKEHNLKQQQQRLQNYLYRNGNNAGGLLNIPPTLGSWNDQTVPRLSNEWTPGNVVASDPNGVVLPVNSLQQQPTPPSRRIVNNFPMTTPPLQTQNEKDAYDILQRIGKVFFCEFVYEFF